MLHAPGCVLVLVMKADERDGHERFI